MNAWRGGRSRSAPAAWPWRVLGIGVSVYLGLMAAVLLLQDAMIFPGAARQGEPGCAVRAGQGGEPISLRTADGERMAALFGAAMTADGRMRPDALQRPTLLYFYGNAMCLADASGEFHQFRRLGLNVLIPDYVGFGMSGGRPSERALYATADAAYSHLGMREGVTPARIISMGWSLGGAVAIDLAHRMPVAGLVVVSTFTSAADMAHRILPFVPHSVLLRSRFESQRKIAQIRAPTLIVHGRQDSIVPYGMAERLAGSAGGRPVTLLPVEGADHNDIFERGGPRLLPALRGLVERDVLGAP
jgi:fermentation-respiration switch protein FrsA (DUF1100 family)